jgi:hypothetical protein
MQDNVLYVPNLKKGEAILAFSPHGLNLQK